MPVDDEGKPVEPVKVERQVREVRRPDGRRSTARAARSSAACYPKCRSTAPIPDDLKEKLKDADAGRAAEEGGAEGGGRRDLPGVRRGR